MMSDETPDTPDDAAANESSLASQPSEANNPDGTDNVSQPHESVDVAATQAEAIRDDGNGPLADLPVYARGLMKIRVPVRVTLAAQRKSIQEIIELGPGSIVKFDKTCDEPLELSVGDRTIATGEVVKVGDKFGLRVGALLAP